MSKNKTWKEIVLMPLVVALVGIIGTFLVTNQQQTSIETRANADRQLKLLEIFSQKIASSKHAERVVAIRLIKALDKELAEKLQPVAAQAVIEGHWVLRRENSPPNYYASWMQMKLSGEKTLTVMGHLWKGKGIYNEDKGYYEWEFQDGKRGRTEFWIDDSGLMRGQVRAYGPEATLPGLNWAFWASRAKGAADLLKDYKSQID